MKISVQLSFAQWAACCFAFTSFQLAVLEVEHGVYNMYSAADYEMQVYVFKILYVLFGAVTVLEECTLGLTKGSK